MSGTMPRRSRERIPSKRRAAGRPKEARHFKAEINTHLKAIGSDVAQPTIVRTRPPIAWQRGAIQLETKRAHDTRDGPRAADAAANVRSQRGGRDTNTAGRVDVPDEVGELRAIAKPRVNPLHGKAVRVKERNTPHVPQREEAEPSNKARVTVVLDDLRGQMLHMHLSRGKHHVHVTTKKRAVAHRRT